MKKTIFNREILLTEEEKTIMWGFLMPPQESKTEFGTFFSVPNYKRLYEQIFKTPSKSDFDLRRQRRDTFIFFKGVSDRAELMETRHFFVDFHVKGGKRYIIFHNREGQEPHPYFYSVREVVIGDYKPIDKAPFIHLQVQECDLYIILTNQIDLLNSYSLSLPLDK